MAEDLYTGTVTATEGAARSDDGALTLEVHEPTALQGSGEGTNPEQLMAAALGSCLLESLRIAATSAGGSTEGASVEARTTLSSGEGAGYSARYDLSVTLPDAGGDAEAVLAQALTICPFTKTIDDGALQVRLA
ncbi:OsmC family protein [Kineococcus sp. LSe6-4]|uniref:OsmC family protein n=1 Tax=Kineococcus halophytocola TaxID=3234027 RepID=A0ABV4GZZ5_9ACTN